jgi:hypothetical protein
MRHRSLQHLQLEDQRSDSFNMFSWGCHQQNVISWDVNVI